MARSRTRLTFLRLHKQKKQQNQQERRFIRRSTEKDEAGRERDSDGFGVTYEDGRVKLARGGRAERGPQD